MTPVLDNIRKLAAEEHAVTEKATPGPLMSLEQHWRGGLAWAVCTQDADGYAAYELAIGLRREEADAFARSRTAVPALCNAVEALLAVVDALPRCTCGVVATLADHGPDGVSEYTCDACAPSSLARWNDYREQAIADLRALGAGPGDDDPGPLLTLTDLPYAAALRKCAAIKD